MYFSVIYMKEDASLFVFYTENNKCTGVKKHVS